MGKKKIKKEYSKYKSKITSSVPEISLYFLATQKEKKIKKQRKIQNEKFLFVFFIFPSAFLGPSKPLK